MVRGQHAQPVGFHLERTIETRAHIFERDYRSQIDDLLGVEMAFEVLEDVIGHVHRRQRHFLGIAQCRAFRRREQRILGIVCQCG